MAYHIDEARTQKLQNRKEMTIDIVGGGIMGDPNGGQELASSY